MAKDPVTPFGKPTTFAPVAPVVAYVIVVIGKLIQAVCKSVPTEEVNEIVFEGVTVIIPLAVAVLQPPCVVMV